MTEALARWAPVYDLGFLRFVRSRAAGGDFAVLQLFFIRNLQTGLVWAAKILTDPLHDIKLYYKAPFRLMRGEFDDRVVPGH